MLSIANSSSKQRTSRRNDQLSRRIKYQSCTRKVKTLLNTVCSQISLGSARVERCCNWIDTWK